MKIHFITICLTLIITISFINPHHIFAQTCFCNTTSGSCQLDTTRTACDGNSLFRPECTTNTNVCNSGGSGSCTCVSISTPTSTPAPTQPPSCVGRTNCCRCDSNGLEPGNTCVSPKTPECKPEGCVCNNQGAEQKSSPPPQFKMCETIADATLKDECIKCVGDESDQSQVATHVWTGLGCLPVSPEGFSSTLLTIALSLGGGFSLLLMIYGAFLVATSAGNPESAQKGKEVFTGAIAGLLFIIFSVVLLRIIGVDILQLPGF